MEQLHDSLEKNIDRKSIPVLKTLRTVKLRFPDPEFSCFREDNRVDYIRLIGSNMSLFLSSLSSYQLSCSTVNTLLTMQLTKKKNSTSRSWKNCGKVFILRKKTFREATQFNKPLFARLARRRSNLFCLSNESGMVSNLQKAEHFLQMTIHPRQSTMQEDKTTTDISRLFSQPTRPASTPQH